MSGYEVIGIITVYLVTAAVLCYATLGSFLVMVNCCGEYNIGGVPNSTKKKILAWIPALLTGTGWVFLIRNILSHLSWS